MIKGHELFSTKLKIQLCFGSEDSVANGCVVFDDITFEKISWAAFNSDVKNSSKLELTTVKNNPTVDRPIKELKGFDSEGNEVALNQFYTKVNEDDKILIA